jgi:hypothetical protein
VKTVADAIEAEAAQVEKIQSSLKLNKVVHLQHYQRLA